MPRTRRAPGQRARVLKRPPGLSDDWIVCPPRSRAELVEDMRAALNEAAGLTQALLVIGHGLDELGREEGCAVKTVARAASKRLECARDTWIDFELATRRKH